MAQRRTHVPHPPSHHLHTISWEHHSTHNLAIVWLLSGPKREETMGKRLPNDMPNEQWGRRGMYTGKIGSICHFRGGKYQTTKADLAKLFLSFRSTVLLMFLKRTSRKIDINFTKQGANCEHCIQDYLLTRNYCENNPLRIIFRNFRGNLHSRNLQERKAFSQNYA